MFGSYHFEASSWSSMMHMLWSIHVVSICLQITSVFLTGISLRILNLLFIIPKALSKVCLALDSFLLNRIVCGDKFPYFFHRGFEPVSQWIGIICQDVVVFQNQYTSFCFLKQCWISKDSGIMCASWPSSISTCNGEVVVYHHLKLFDIC